MSLDLSSVTLTQLRYVVAVDRHRSFRSAADHCRVSQPALSMQVQKLEEILGVPVFDRSHQPVVTTERGVAIVAQARAVLRECDRLSDVAQAIEGPTGTFRLGIIPTLGPSLVPLLLPALAAAHPRLRLIVSERTTDELTRGLLDDSLDGGLAVTPLDIGQVRERPLFLEPFYVYLSPRHPLRSRKLLKQSELVEERPWLLSEGHCFRSQVLHLCKIDRRSVEADTVSSVESSTFETLTRLVDAGEGLTLLPELVVRTLPAAVRRRQVRAFASPVPARQVSFVYVRDRLRTLAAEAIVDTLLARLPKRGRGREEERAIVPVR